MADRARGARDAADVSAAAAPRHRAGDEPRPRAPRPSACGSRGARSRCRSRWRVRPLLPMPRPPTRRRMPRRRPRVRRSTVRRSTPRPATSGRAARGRAWRGRGPRRARSRRPSPGEPPRRCGATEPSSGGRRARPRGPRGPHVVGRARHRRRGERGGTDRLGAVDRLSAAWRRVCDAGQFPRAERRCLPVITFGLKGDPARVRRRFMTDRHGLRASGLQEAPSSPEVMPGSHTRGATAGRPISGSERFWSEGRRAAGSASARSGSNAAGDRRAANHRDPRARTQKRSLSVIARRPAAPNPTPPGRAPSGRSRARS